MAGTPLGHELQVFAVELFERAGGVADWPVPEGPGSVVVPAEIAAAAQLPDEEFSLSLTAASGTAASGSLHVNLASEFLDTASRLLDIGVPRDGSFCIPDRYLTRRDLAEKIGQTFSWQNARAKFRTAEPALVSYHLWMLQGTLKSEDVWEGLFQFAVNEERRSDRRTSRRLSGTGLARRDGNRGVPRSRHLRHGDRGREAEAHVGNGRIRSPH